MLAFTKHHFRASGTTWLILGCSASLAAGQSESHAPAFTGSDAQTQAEVSRWLESQLSASLNPFKGWGPCRLGWTTEITRSVDPAKLDALRKEVGNKVDHPKRSQLAMLESSARLPVIWEQSVLWFGSGGPTLRWRFDRLVPNATIPGTMIRTESARDGNAAWIVSDGVQTLTLVSTAATDQSTLKYEQHFRQTMLELQFCGIRSVENLVAPQALSVTLDGTDHWSALIQWPTKTESHLVGQWNAEAHGGIILSRTFGDSTTICDAQTVTTPHGATITAGVRHLVRGHNGPSLLDVSVEPITESELASLLRPQSPTDRAAATAGQTIRQIMDMRSDGVTWTDFDADGLAIRSGSQAGPVHRNSTIHQTGMVTLIVFAIIVCSVIVYRVRRNYRVG